MHNLGFRLSYFSTIKGAHIIGKGGGLLITIKKKNKKETNKKIEEKEASLHQ